jgi:hypothetical protein
MDYAILPLVSVSMLTTFPFICILLVITVIKRVRKISKKIQERSNQINLGNIEERVTEIDETTKFEIQQNKSLVLA